MFKKILVVEDYDSINVGIVTALSEKYSAEIYNTKYCDDAWLKIQNAHLNSSPFDLIITDLSFEQDYREQKLEGGIDLIEVIKANYPDTKIIVYSIENRYIEINTLIEKLKIDAYISKGRNSINELHHAIEHIQSTPNCYLSPDIEDITTTSTALILSDEDLEIISLLSKGYTQQEISAVFKSKSKTISSTSSIEKRIGKLKLSFEAKNTIHLVSIAKDLGLI
ncbi:MULTISPECIES: response regulator [Myroides]|uniref:Response regulator n=1 Tax=Myroides albus TaxID=2562892 RepID=A0A6I3LJZ6_9FLAO|nr:MULTISPECIES: response regulator [Myroides]MTG96801.1 response regulator [Myroides albus]MVX35001.1 response regulator [Myroides sp. LoEW2-1]UVD78449.1 response regulator [Myroides albus]